jgi:A/G-specific adenine glycosylase
MNATDSIRSHLLEWFDGARRDLPWRRTTDPYGIWISEVMLQQTQVERVVEYYERFLRAFPTVEALAAADIDDVLKAWEGLGYYARARALHQAARIIVRDHAGMLPTSAVELGKLPGFGAYTAAAVASIAFGERIAALDVNAFRVLARLFRVEGVVTNGATKARLRALGEGLVDPRRPGDFNAAMMELGALVCRPRAPLCLLCPLAEACEARASGDPERWPERAPVAERPTVHAACGVVWRRGKVLVVRRPERGLLGGLWEFPGGRCADGESPEDACVRGVYEKTGIRVECVSSPADGHAIRHSFSHFHVVLHPFSCRDLGGRLSSSAARWVTESELEKLALTRTARKIALTEPGATARYAYPEW